MAWQVRYVQVQQSNTGHGTMHAVLAEYAQVSGTAGGAAVMTDKKCWFTDCYFKVLNPTKVGGRYLCYMHRAQYNNSKGLDDMAKRTAKIDQYVKVMALYLKDDNVRMSNFTKRLDEVEERLDYLESQGRRRND